MIDLSPWPGLSVTAPLGGGHRNDVYEVRGRDRLVARRTRRTAPAMEWELDLLEFLDHCGFVVPHTVPTADGRRSAGGVVVQTWLHGREPVGGDWALVASELGRLHRLTAGWANQRPGFRSTRELQRESRGGDIDLDAMPDHAVHLCRQAWAALSAGPDCVIHGDPGPGNVRMSGGRVGFLDWDESRVDHADLDLAEIPGGPLRGHRAAVASNAIDAWEAACSVAITHRPGHGVQHRGGQRGPGDGRGQHRLRELP
ncbi:phosphotransferase enzyme family protein [Pseudonocardia sp. EV170527-09]|uniref:phosphotransferase enzyme family protein n=1 Tax=Pseudonocardia sp. EV170527-09 TaxID=2603411 RepID=UPI00138717F5|nr:phosphotransferase [Pseudonocardia sp. EV170527-09]